MSLKNCYNFDDFRKLAKKKLPSPIFHYIDGGADDETTLKRNTLISEEQLNIIRAISLNPCADPNKNFTVLIIGRNHPINFEKILTLHRKELLTIILSPHEDTPF